LKQYHKTGGEAGGASPASSHELLVKQLKEEIARLKAINKNRDEILSDLD
jgi:hypothetical protein